MEKYGGHTDTNPENKKYAEINKELREIIHNLANLENKELRKEVFARMVSGPELQPSDLILTSFFEEIETIEEKYGQENVAKMASFYMAPDEII